ncbi:MAG: 30S ribosomal protein S16, partial [Candidatus Competibacterales bacterium]
MVTIRLSRGGAKKRPFYQVIVANSRSRRDGRYIERLGYFNPLARGKATRLELNMARVEHWLNLGAQPTDRAAALIREYPKDQSAALATADT